MNPPHRPTQEPAVADLISQTPSDADWALAARYAPVLLFDAVEPFLPSVVGYTVFRENGPSPSFPRQVGLDEAGQVQATIAIEYAIWWDWDIGHLYELEHVWVYLDAGGRVVRAEASWHGGYHDMAVKGVLSLSGERLTIYSEPGKHAFAPTSDWLAARATTTQKSCARHAGRGGVWITPLFEGVITVKTPQADRLVHTYLERLAFEPSYHFSRCFLTPLEALVPWPALQEWIPRRVGWWVSELERTILSHERRFLRIAHRGASDYAPENTLAAIVKAAECGADMVELDVHESADGVPVIIHDAELSRTTNGQGLVSRHAMSELKKLDAGNGERIPTLEEAIDCCLEHDLGLYLEIKSGPVVPALIESIQRRDLYHRTIVCSFRPDWLAQAKKLDPGIVTAALFSAVDIDAVGLAQAVGATYVHLAWERRASEPHKLLTEAWIDTVRAAGLGIVCRHEERPSEIAALRQLGVDGICSNAPDLLLPAG
ncbi:MAG: glycerophosphodiester phosphodiesterase [Ardenticatenaceae bacterium]